MLAWPKWREGLLIQEKDTKNPAVKVLFLTRYDRNGTGKERNQPSSPSFLPTRISRDLDFERRHVFKFQYRSTPGRLRDSTMAHSGGRGSSPQEPGGEGLSISAPPQWHSEGAHHHPRTTPRAALKRHRVILFVHRSIPG